MPAAPRARLAAMGGRLFQALSDKLDDLRIDVVRRLNSENRPGFPDCVEIDSPSLAATAESLVMQDDGISQGQKLPRGSLEVSRSRIENREVKIGRKKL